MATLTDWFLQEMENSLPIIFRGQSGYCCPTLAISFPRINRKRRSKRSINFWAKEFLKQEFLSLHSSNSGSKTHSASIQMNGSRYKNSKSWDTVSPSRDRLQRWFLPVPASAFPSCLRAGVPTNPLCDRQACWH